MAIQQKLIHCIRSLSVFLNKQCQSSKTKDVSFLSDILCAIRYARELSHGIY
jgi:hypothetical protein